MQKITIQYASEKSLAPKPAALRQWAKQVLTEYAPHAELTIRIVNTQEMAELNHTFRKKAGPTNVLSFPFSAPEDLDIDIPLLGDIVVCSEVVNDEAKEQHKSAEAHWAHMIVHGVFHLLGYDHEDDTEAKEMEALEIKVMTALGYANPYESGDEINHND